jgi:hypothetical protein
MKTEKQKVYQREYKKRPEVKAIASDQHKRWRAANYRENWLKRTEQRCTKYGWSFNLTLDDLEIPERCPALGILIVPNDPNKWQSPSIDRINPDLGYVKGNIAIISFRANQIKSNSSIEEMEKVLKYYKSVTQ